MFEKAQNFKPEQVFQSFEDFKTLVRKTPAEIIATKNGEIALVQEENFIKLMGLIENFQNVDLKVVRNRTNGNGTIKYDYCCGFQGSSLISENNQSRGEPSKRSGCNFKVGVLKDGEQYTSLCLKKVDAIFKIIYHIFEHTV